MATKMKMQKGGIVDKMQAGGRTISAKAAERKSAKGKGFTSSVMGPNPSEDKGKYVPFTRQGRKDAKEKGMVSSNEMKPSRKIMQAGGVVDKIRSGMRNMSRKINAPIKKTFKASAQKYQTGGTSGAQLKKEGAAMKAKGMAMKAKGQAQSVEKFENMKRANNQVYNPVNKMKTGGMVNSNAKVAASRVASGRPVKSAEPKSAAKKATGRVGGISKSPRAAAPKMKMGGSMKRK